MVKAELVNQLMITVVNKAGTMADVSGIIAAAGINMIALCAYAVDNKGFILFVSDDNKKALKLLQEKKYQVREEEAVLVEIENKPGALQVLTKRIADAGIDLNLIYGSVEKKGKTSPIILVAEDNKTVLAMIKMQIGSR